MFHHSTTLHHRHSQSFVFHKEKRLVHVGWLAQKKMQAAVAWEYMNPLRRVARVYSWAFGWPLITKGADYTVKGLGKVADGAEWSAHASLEVGKGTAKMTAKPLWLLAWSRIVALKRMMWNVPLATLSAAVRTPIALAKSPLEMAGGVRDAITSIPKNAQEVFNSFKHFKLGEMLSNTRKAVTDVLLPPLVNPIKPILEPAYNVANTALGAELQTVSKARAGVESVVEGWRDIGNAGNVASSKLAANNEARYARKKAADEEKKARAEAWKAKVDAEMNRDVPDSVKAKAA